MTHAEDPEQLHLRHVRLQVLVVRRHRRVGQIVVRRDATQTRALEQTRLHVVLDQRVLRQRARRAVDQVHAVLQQRRVRAQHALVTPVQHGVLQHADVQVGVA